MFNVKLLVGFWELSIVVVWGGMNFFMGKDCVVIIVGVIFVLCVGFYGLKFLLIGGLF